MQLTMVSADPFEAGGAVCATNVENMGESAITTVPQNPRKIINTIKEPEERKRGEHKQQIPDSNNAVVAIRFAPHREENSPLSTQESPPIAMIQNDQKETLNDLSGC